MVDIITNAGNTGLIHADPHPGNALFDRGAVKLSSILTTAAPGPRLYDLAVALWELRDRPDHPLFRDALLSGYSARRDLHVRDLDDYIALRRVGFDLWYTATAPINPVFSARLDRVHRWSLEMVDLLEAS